MTAIIGKVIADMGKHAQHFRAVSVCEWLSDMEDRIKMITGMCDCWKLILSVLHYKFNKIHFWDLIERGI